MKILIGSHALKISGDQFLCSNPYRTWDFDWIGSFQEYESYKSSLSLKKTVPISGKVIALFEKNSIHEFEIAWTGSNSEKLLEIAANDTDVAFRHSNGIDYVGTPNLLFSLKKSHRYLKNSPHFMKTMLDYNHLKGMGCVIPNSLNDWYSERLKETYTYKHPKLKDVSKNSFFKDDMIPYKYDHDTLHLAVKHLDQPAYNYFKPNTTEVECSKEMFDACPEEIKLYSVLEESYVLALERSQIPAPNATTPRQSFLIALMKCCTSIASGFWREYAYENYFKVLNLYSDSYLDRFKYGLQSGIVKPFKGTYPHMDL